MKLLSVNVSLPREIEHGGKTVRTGIFKQPTADRVMLGELNIDGDGQADLVGHGGIYKAAYAYSFENYRYWEDVLDRSDFTFGQFGENLTVEGMRDEDIHVGDTFRIGGALVEVTQPRVPCFKLAIKMGIPGFEHVFMSHDRVGFYLRVLEKGEIGAGDVIERVDADPVGMSIAEVHNLLYFDLGNLTDARRALRIEALSPGWRGSFEDRLVKAEEHGKTAESFIPVIVDRVERESDTIASFYLRTADGSALPLYKPGQFLPMRLDIPGEPRPLIRTYSLSDRPGLDYYRLTVKREPTPADQPDAPPGRSSNHFHDRIKRGTRLRIRPPRGKFHLDPTERSPVALVSAGVGLTPMISMLNAIVEAGAERPAWFIHGARNGAEHAMGAHVRRLAAENDFVHCHVRYSRPRDGDTIGQDYDSEGHLDAPLMVQLLPDEPVDYYLCGPTPFLKSVFNGLRDNGVAEERIHYEFFGPASALREDDVGGAQPTAAEPSAGFAVSFKRSGVSGTWDPAFGTLLDMAERLGLNPPYSCRSGICQTCLCSIESGEAEYLEEPLDPPDDGSVLICSAKPASDIVIDI